MFVKLGVAHQGKNVDRRYEENWLRRKVFGLKREEEIGA